MPALTRTAPPATTLWQRNRRHLTAAGVLVVAAVAAVPISRHFRGHTDGPSYATATATRGDVIVRVTASGTLSPVVEVDVGSQVSGRIKSLEADFNDEVHTGEVIATLDPELLESAVAQANARLAAARASLEKAKALSTNAALQYDRVSGLGEAGVVAGADVDKALADKRTAAAEVTSAKSAVTQAMAALNQAKESLAYTVIKSPIDGVVVSRNVDVGQTVAASLSAPVLFVIAGDLRKMELHTSVAESDVGRIASGMAVELSVDAYPDRRFRGVVRQVRYNAEVVSNVVTYDAVVSVDNDDLALRPGMTATVDFLVAVHRDVVTVPNQALRYRPATARSAAKSRRPPTTKSADPATRSGQVWILGPGGPEPVLVKLGLTDGSRTEVQGIAAGDLILTGDGAVGSSRSGPPGRSGNRGGRRRGVL